MFCPQCGNQVPDGTAFCPACGKQVGEARTTRDEPASNTQGQIGVSSQQTAGASQYDAERYRSATARPAASGQASRSPVAGSQQYASSNGMSTTNDYSKLGGWLLFFFILWIVGGIYNIYNGISAWVVAGGYLSMLGSYGMGGLSAVIAGVCIVSVIAGIGGLAMCWFIYKRNPIMLRYYQLFNIAIIALYIVVAIIMAVVINGLGSYASAYTGAYMVGMVSGVIGGIIGIVLMTMYFCKSERVRIYMGNDEYLQRAIFRIGM